ncbi:threonine/homoserine/homoserine lactone efflux protein [Inhella inkyongensis]|uniref:Threonine/homoserine/homoserine lactone efflux protein n=1 Tax=Inhella inkyongensis TaxID=392593 RepID=A0A840S0X9_9BURK|nr:LysE family translocator [Inhella inkyongensis]MBB5203172.1 threonine/homoserine/homoserine lactone efflux protein [Inhella inkyongensis]
MDALLTLPQLLTFLGAAFLLTLAPGPDNLMVLSLGLARGRRAGLAFGAGCALGCLNHTLLATLGVGALIAASPLAFDALRWAGGLYLLWLGVGALRAAWRSAGGFNAPLARTESPTRLFAKGLFVNAINPKVVMFFLAFLPQFVDAGRGQAAWQMAQLGLLFTLQALLVFGAIGWFAGQFGESLKRQPSLGRWLDGLAGAVFVGLGARLLLVR